ANEGPRMAARPCFGEEVRPPRRLRAVDDADEARAVLEDRDADADELRERRREIDVQREPVLDARQRRELRIPHEHRRTDRLLVRLVLRTQAMLTPQPPVVR